MATLGQRLREEREKRGLTIADLAEQLRINARYFEAIERDDKALLPGGFFYRSFLRQYARLMGLPEGVYQPEVDRSLAEEAERPYEAPGRRIAVPPMPTGRSNPGEEARWWAARVGALVVALAVCGGLYMGWQRWKAAQEAEVAQPGPASREAAAEPKRKEAAQPGGGGAAEEEVRKEEESGPNEDVNAAAASGAVRVIIRATEVTWIGVWQGQKLLFGDLMRAGEVRGFGADDVLRVRMGNAGGVSVEWNGQAVPELGPRGQVRTVEFRRDGYTVIQPAGKGGEMEAPAPDGA